MGKSWWENQGYSKDHPVHKGTGFVVPPAFAPKSDPTEAAERAEDVSAEVGGLIPLCTDRIPARTTDPSRPRTLAHGYDAESRTLRVDFRDGATYYYYDVDPGLHRQYHQSASPGKFINRRLAGKAYGQVA